MCWASLAADSIAFDSEGDSQRNGNNSAWFLISWLLKPLLPKRCRQVHLGWFLIFVIRATLMTAKQWQPACSGKICEPGQHGNTRRQPTRSTIFRLHQTCLLRILVPTLQTKNGSAIYVFNEQPSALGGGGTWEGERGCGFFWKQQPVNVLFLRSTGSVGGCLPLPELPGFFVRGGKGPNNRYRRRRLVGNQGPALPLCLQAPVCLCRIFAQKQKEQEG